MATVFIVDDDNSIRTLYQKMLTIKGYDVIGTARNGAEAVKLFKSFTTKPDVILMDHRMPVKNGIEATKEILQIDKTTKIIFASADKSVKANALSIGARRFKLKPFKMQLLIQTIEIVLTNGGEVEDNSE